MAVGEAWGVTFDQGFLCALVSFYVAFPAHWDLVLRILSSNGFDTYEKALSANPDEYDADKLKEIYGVGRDDSR